MKIISFKKVELEKSKIKAVAYIEIENHITVEARIIEGEDGLFVACKYSESLDDQVRYNYSQEISRVLLENYNQE